MRSENQDRDRESRSGYDRVDRCNRSTWNLEIEGHSCGRDYFGTIGFIRTHPSAFTKCWVLKEAYLKATGEGLAGGLDALELAPGTDSTIEAVALGRAGAGLSQWRFASFDVTKTIVGSVAVMTDGKPLDIEIAHLDPNQPAGGPSSTV